MALVGAANFTGTLAAHALPSQMATMKKYLVRLPKALPKVYASWSAGLSSAKLITDRVEKYGPQGCPIKTTWNNYTRSNEDIFVDKDLPSVLPRAEFLKYMQWRKDLYATGQMFAPSLVLGPLGLVQVFRQLRCEHELPAAFYETDEDLVQARLTRDMLRLQHAPAVRGWLYHMLAHNLISDTTHEAVVYTEDEYLAMEELFDMDSVSMTKFEIWEKHIPAMHNRSGEVWRISPEATLSLGKFFGFPVSTLGGRGRLKNLIQHMRILRQDDEYIRVGGGAAALSDSDLFAACFERAIARQEEVNITRDELELRLTTWLKLGDASVWKGKLAHGDVPSVFFQVLLASNVYCDPAYDPKLDEMVISKIAKTEGVDADAVSKDLKGSFEKYFESQTGVLKSEALAAYEAKELTRAESELNAQRKLDDLVTSLQRVANPVVQSEDVVEMVATEEHAEAKAKVPPLAKHILTSFLDRPAVPELTPEQLKEAEKEKLWRNRDRALSPGKAVSTPLFDNIAFAAAKGLVKPQSEVDAKAAEERRKAEELPGL